LSNIEAYAFPSSESIFFNKAIFLDKNTVLLAFSRSGKTTETIDACKVARKQKTYRIGFLTVPNSEIVNYLELSIIIAKAKEKSIVMTQSFSTMVFFSIVLSNILTEDRRKNIDEIPIFCQKNINIVENFLKEFNFSKYKKIVFLGSGPIYGIACESMLVLREMANIDSEAFSTLEYRHGPKSTLNKDTLVVIYLSKNMKKEELKLREEVNSICGGILLVGKGIDANLRLKLMDNDYLNAPLYIVFSQLLGYKISIKKGINPDKPQNLEYFVKLK
jgi:glucosamine--fructose-6-phosphate aminotransferase (isomerizing)